MVNTINHVNNPEIEALKDKWKSLSEWALQQEMWMYYSNWDYEKWDALRKFIEEQKNPTYVESKSEDFSKKFDDLQAKLAEIEKNAQEDRANKNLKPRTKDYIDSQRSEAEEKNRVMREFFMKDMQGFVSTVNQDISNLKWSKDAEINDLKAQLSWIVVEWPKFRDFLSKERRRLVKIEKEITNLKTGKDSANYPKNVLVYIMALTDSWWWQAIRRGWIKMKWKKEATDIKSWFKVIEDKLTVKPDDSLWLKWLKKQLEEHFWEAKKAYVDKQYESVWLTK